MLSIPLDDICVEARSHACGRGLSPAVLNVVDYQTKDRAGKSKSVTVAEVRQNQRRDALLTNYLPSKKPAS
jgi:hypothetical protein